VALFLISRRVPVVAAVIIVLAALLRALLIWRWDSYGALQLPLMVETGCAVLIAGAAASRLGEPERVGGRWLPVLRLGATLALTGGAAAALAAAGIGAHMAGGSLDMLRNLAGSTGLGLLCAAVLGGGLAWTGPAGHLIAAAYALYAAWHGTPTTSPLLWPARAPSDIGAWLCAGLVFVIGVAVVSVRGARDRAEE